MFLPRRRRPLAPRPVGAPPGSFHVAEDAHPLQVRWMGYGPEHCTEGELTPENVEERLASAPVVWIDVVGIGDAARFARLGEVLGLHPLLVEDVVHGDQRPKAESWNEDLFLLLRMAHRSADPQPLADASVAVDVEQVAFVLRPGLLITFQERPGDVFEPVRERIRRGGPRLRRGGADYLCYALVDAVVDAYFPLLDAFHAHLESLEDQLLDDEAEVNLQGLHRVRRELIALRRTVAPMREAVSQISRGDGSEDPFTAETRVYLRDVYDHLIRILDGLETARELVAGLTDLHLTVAGHRTNEAMRVLTVIATIFIPLSFLVGLYGMNFDTSSPWNMPELGWRYGYPALLLFMAAVVVGLLVFFRKKDFL